MSDSNSRDRISSSDRRLYREAERLREEQEQEQDSSGGLVDRLRDDPRMDIDEDEPSVSEPSDDESTDSSSRRSTPTNRSSVASPTRRWTSTPTRTEDRMEDDAGQGQEDTQDSSDSESDSGLVGHIRDDPRADIDEDEPSTVADSTRNQGVNRSQRRQTTPDGFSDTRTMDDIPEPTDDPYNERRTIRGADRREAIQIGMGRSERDDTVDDWAERRAADHSEMAGQIGSGVADRLWGGDAEQTRRHAYTRGVTTGAAELANIPGAYLIGKNVYEDYVYTVSGGEQEQRQLDGTLEGRPSGELIDLESEGEGVRDRAGEVGEDYRETGEALVSYARENPWEAGGFATAFLAPAGATRVGRGGSRTDTGTGATRSDYGRRDAIVDEIQRFARDDQAQMTPGGGLIQRGEGRRRQRRDGDDGQTIDIDDTTQFRPEDTRSNIEGSWDIDARQQTHQTLRDQQTRDRDVMRDVADSDIESGPVRRTDDQGPVMDGDAWMQRENQRTMRRQQEQDMGGSLYGRQRQAERPEVTQGERVPERLVEDTRVSQEPTTTQTRQQQQVRGSDFGGAGLIGGQAERQRQAERPEVRETESELPGTDSLYSGGVAAGTMNRMLEDQQVGDATVSGTIQPERGREQEGEEIGQGLGIDTTPRDITRDRTGTTPRQTTPPRQRDTPTPRDPSIRDPTPPPRSPTARPPSRPPRRRPPRRRPPRRRTRVPPRFGISDTPRQQPDLIESPTPATDQRINPVAGIGSLFGANQRRDDDDDRLVGGMFNVDGLMSGSPSQRPSGNDMFEPPSGNDMFEPSGGDGLLGGNIDGDLLGGDDGPNNRNGGGLL